MTFRSHLDGSTHRFTPEVSMQIQHQLGADVIFAFDELTTLMNTRDYQEKSVARTQAWAERCVAEHRRLGSDPAAVRRRAGRAARGPAPPGGSRPRHPRLRRLRHRRRDREGEPRPDRRLGRRRAARGPPAAPAGHRRAGRPVHGRRAGLRHVRLRAAVAGGPRLARLHRPGPAQPRPSPPRGAASRRSRTAATATPARTTPSPTCTTCSRRRSTSPRRSTTIHNERFVVRLVDDMRAAIEAGDFAAMKTEFLGGYSA